MDKYTPILKQANEPPPRPSWLKDCSRCVIRGSNWLGDALMSLPATYKLKGLLPSGAQLAVLCPSNLSAIWEACPWVERVFSMKGKRLDTEERAAVRNFHAELGVVFPNSFGSAFDLWRCGISHLLGREGNFRGWMLDVRLPQWKRHKGQSDRHQLSHYLELVSAMGAVPWDCDCPPLSIDPGLSHGIHRGDGWLAIAPGAAFGPAKQWPMEHFLAVASHWCSTRHGNVVLVGTAKECPVTNAIAEALPAKHCLDLAGKTTMKELMAVLANVDFAVANDSGAMHLAAALGTNGCAIFGSTDSIATGPIGATWTLLSCHADCSPCFLRECPLKEATAYKCLYNVSPRQAIDALPERQ